MLVDYIAELTNFQIDIGTKSMEVLTLSYHIYCLS